MVIINIYIAFKTIHIFKSALHYAKCYKLALNTFLKKLFRVRLLQDLIGNGIYQ